VRLDGRLLAGTPWLELVLSVDWRQRHELLRLEVPLQQRADAVPDHAQAFREPLWLRPAAASQPLQRPLALPPLPAGVQMVGLRSLGDGTATLALANHTPCRQSVDLGPAWQLLARLDGLDQSLGPARGSSLQLTPWQLGFWGIRPA
jgi:hypothetical protein